MEIEINKALLEKIKDDKIRAINLELLDETIISGYWTYKFIYSEKGEIKEDIITGKDMSDALYRFSVLNNRKMTMFKYPKSLKKN